MSLQLARSKGDAQVLSDMASRNIRSRHNPEGNLFYNSIYEGDVTDILYAIEHAGDMVGYILLDGVGHVSVDMRSTMYNNRVLPDWEGALKQCQYIKQFLVDKPYRGRGVGTEAYKDLVNLASTLDIVLFSTVERSNKVSMRVHEKTGFVAVGDISPYEEMMLCPSDDFICYVANTSFFQSGGAHCGTGNIIYLKRWYAVGYALERRGDTIMYQPNSSRIQHFEENIKDILVRGSNGNWVAWEEGMLCGI